MICIFLTTEDNNIPDKVVEVDQQANNRQDNNSRNGILHLLISIF